MPYCEAAKVQSKRVVGIALKPCEHTTATARPCAHISNEPGPTAHTTARARANLSDRIAVRLALFTCAVEKPHASAIPGPAPPRKPHCCSGEWRRQRRLSCSSLLGDIFNKPFGSWVRALRARALWIYTLARTAVSLKFARGTLSCAHTTTVARDIKRHGVCHSNRVNRMIWLRSAVGVTKLRPTAQAPKPQDVNCHTRPRAQPAPDRMANSSRASFAD